ncbi:hypothetical protein J5N97_010934 [Dioscorea zingiberensis]|uniref:Phytocyanin domain-containing protein n=1 Tax=Dioscorea zingiberensis TaxID=325984 RepID=A0A9D5D161_9LILI|nr:hypothetical protein J5N97_010934 [Dioscorea zingiberensis]
MASSSTLSVLALFLFVGSSMSEVYKVGDSDGWTIIGNVNYTAWSSSKKFKVGDIILFEYNSKFHNVMEVSKDDYHACNAAAPRATYTTGNDSITIKRRGHHFFLCGFPGHCQAGQKVDIRIPKLASAATSPAATTLSPESPTVIPLAPPASSVVGTTSAPSPHPSTATSISSLGLMITTTLVVSVVSFCYLSY